MDKINFKKGSATFIFGYMIMMICLIVAFVLFESFSKYINSLNTQMATDSISDGTAVYAQTLRNETSDEMYQDSMARAELILELIRDNTSVNNITDMEIHEDSFINDNIVYAKLSADYNSTDYYDESPTYNLTRYSATTFTAHFGSDGGWPVPGYYYISSPFGPRHLFGEFHWGMDIPCPIGTEVVAWEDGVVFKSYLSSSAGEFIIIDHGNGIMTEYMHNSRRLVQEGESVRAGQVIALSGNTGQSTGPHSHFGVKLNGVRVDPAPYLGLPERTVGDVSSYFN